MRSSPDADKNENAIPWFKHKAGMRNHVKVQVLRSEFGLEGYAVWCYILELFCEKPQLRFSSDPFDLRLLAGGIGISSDRFIQIVELCFSLRLIYKDDEGFYYSPSFHESMESYLSKKEYDRNKSAELRAKKKNEMSENSSDSDPELFSPKEKESQRLSKNRNDYTESRSDFSTDKIRQDKTRNNTLSPITDITRAREGPGEPKPERERVLSSELQGFLTELTSSHTEFSVAWDSWVRHRESEGRQMTPEIQIEDLRFLQAQPNPVECIRFSIRKGWPALYPVKPEQYQAPTVQGLRKRKPKVEELPTETASRDTIAEVMQQVRKMQEPSKKPDDEFEPAPEEPDPEPKTKVKSIGNLLGEMQRSEAPP